MALIHNLAKRYAGETQDHLQVCKYDTIYNLIRFLGYLYRILLWLILATYWAIMINYWSSRPGNHLPSCSQNFKLRINYGEFDLINCLLIFSWSKFYICLVKPNCSRSRSSEKNVQIHFGLNDGTSKFFPNKKSDVEPVLFAICVSSDFVPIKWTSRHLYHAYLTNT